MIPVWQRPLRNYSAKTMKVVIVNVCGAVWINYHAHMSPSALWLTMYPIDRYCQYIHSLLFFSLWDLLTVMHTKDWPYFSHLALRNKANMLISQETETWPQMKSVAYSFSHTILQLSRTGKLGVKLIYNGVPISCRKKNIWCVRCQVSLCTENSNGHNLSTPPCFHY